MHAKTVGLLAVVSFVAATPAPAHDAPTLDAALAQRIVQGCFDHAARKRQSHAIAVMDPGGSLVAFLRMDRNTPGVVDFALAKAGAVAHWRFATTGMAEAAASTPGFGAAPHVVTVAGGVPVYASDGRVFLGAVGVSGEDPADDAACAEAGIAAAGLRSKRTNT